MDFFSQTWQLDRTWQELCTALEGGESPVSITGLPQAAKAHFLTALAQKCAPILVMTANEAEAVRLCSDYNTLSGAEDGTVFPSKELILTQMEGVTTAYEHSRIAAVTALHSGQCRVVFASAEAVMQPTIPVQDLESRTITLTQGKELNLPQLSEQLTAIGYARCEKVDGAGQFSVRGDILDIFPVQMMMPVRVELWGEEIDSLSLFDTDTQRRTESIVSAVIPPAREFLCDPLELAAQIRKKGKSLRGRYAEMAREKLYADAEKLESGLSLAHIGKYAPLMQPEPTMLYHYGITTVCYSEYGGIAEAQRSLMAQYREDMTQFYENGNLCRGLEGYYIEPAVLGKALAQRTEIALSNFLQGTSHLPFRRLLSVQSVQNAPWGGEMRQLVEDLNAYRRQKVCVFLFAGSDKTLSILQQDLEQDGIPCSLADAQSSYSPGRVYLCAGHISSGIDYPELKLAVLTQNQQLRTSKKHRRHAPGEELRSLADLQPGDLVVHALHGIGKFLGIRKLELENVVKDYITIQYAHNENLYVPVTQLDLVSKYIGAQEENHVRLHSLSSTDWQKARSRVRKAAKDMADQLLALYAEREKASGFAFYPDEEEQREFEARFPYMETDDQLASIEEIKRDMERPRPMDRLLCGDVGFGKTEVALRAAMKCIMSGKQCAILVPTTVLALQHYQTAKNRFEAFPVDVEMLSRFVPAAKQREIKKGIKSGRVDLVIGTHAVVQKSVEFHDLGLAIVDEEQRFGVGQKERFKEMVAGVDVLTLSATPIPRTLNMAMSGIRDMSVIAQPPQDRYPVQTYVMEYDDGVIMQAIRREVKRGGQVYYIHNRIEMLDYIAARLQKAMPELRVATAHGKLDERQMSEIWRQLMEQEIDVLICTTIIETGIDVPNVNTLILEDADRFGLSQLYQLRGRVGRSNRRAFAYFTFKKDKVLREESARRLAAMREFTQFGSGFHIALRDLEIRGAGSILGGSQHGHMEAVGYEMYMRLLNEAIAEAKGEPIQETAECVIDVQISAHIPEQYIPSLHQRLEMYRKIASVQSDAQESDLVDELIDRYGEPPLEVLGLIRAARLRSRAAKQGITEIAQRMDTLYIYTEHPKPEQIASLSRAFRGHVTFGTTKRPYLAVPAENQTVLEQIKKVLDVFEKSEV